MRQINLLLAPAIMVLGLGASVALADLAPPPPQVQADMRQAEMKKLGAAMKAVAAFLEGKGTIAEARDAYAAASAVPQAIPGLFPAGTAMGDPGIEKSEALPAIWENTAEFETASANLVPAWNELGTALDGGDAAAIGPALKSVGAMCKACHVSFRKPPDQQPAPPPAQ